MNKIGRLCVPIPRWILYDNFQNPSTVRNGAKCSRDLSGFYLTTARKSAITSVKIFKIKYKSQLVRKAHGEKHCFPGTRMM